MNNLKQLGMALIMYASDYNGYCPASNLTYHAYPKPYRHSWVALLTHLGYTPYLDSATYRRLDANKAGIYRCPSAPFYSGSETYNHTYGMRCTYVNAAFPGQFRFERIFTRSSPSEDIWIADSFNITAGYNVQWFEFDSGFSDTNPGKSIHVRHNGTANCWFLDGHVESCSPSALQKYGATCYIDNEGNLIYF